MSYLFQTRSLSISFSNSFPLHIFFKLSLSFGCSLSITLWLSLLFFSLFFSLPPSRLSPSRCLSPYLPSLCTFLLHSLALSLWLWQNYFESIKKNFNCIGHFFWTDEKCVFEPGPGIFQDWANKDPAWLIFEPPTTMGSNTSSLPISAS